MVALDRQLQILVDAYTVETLYIFCRIGTIELVDNPADADVRTHFQGSGHIDILITATAPVVIFHQSAVHLHHTATRMNHEAGVGHTVVESYEERGHFEN